MLLKQLIFNHHRLFSRQQIRREDSLVHKGKKGAGSKIWETMKGLLSFLGIFLSFCWQCWMSVRACRCPVGLQGTMCIYSRCGLEGLEGLMTWALLTLALFACSPHRLIFWHPKYSATCHQTMDRQPHLNGRNSTRESHHNPGLHTQKFKKFILPLHHWARLCPARLTVPTRGGSTAS